jgi:hypothetical protein
MTTVPSGAIRSQPHTAAKVTSSEVPLGEPNPLKIGGAHRFHRSRAGPRMSAVVGHLLGTQTDALFVSA